MAELMPPEAADFRFAVFCGSSRLGLRHEPEQAVALFADRGAAEAYGAGMWPTTFSVIDTQEPDQA